VDAAADCSVCELAVALDLTVVTVCKSQVYPITNPNPIFSDKLVTIFNICLGGQAFCTLN
jgi:hypothetical protein